MRQLYAVHPEDFKGYTTARIRENFLLENLFVSGKANFAYTHYDRMIVGGVMPSSTAIELPNFGILKADYFLERREMGVINVGGNSNMTVDGKKYELSKLYCLYIGKGSQKVSFASNDANSPA